MSEAPSRDPRAERSRAALRGALAALLEEGPFEEIACLTVARRAGVGYATFYRNYTGMEALLTDLAGTLIGELAALSTGSTDDPEATAAAITQFVDARRTVMRPLLTGASAQVQRAIQDHAIAVARSSHSSPTLPTSLAVSHQVCTVLNILRWWLEQGADYPPEQVADFIERLALRA